jgi:hypothetical protein
MNSTEKTELQDEEYLDQAVEETEDSEDERLSDSLNEQDEERREARRQERKKRREGQKFARDRTKEEMQRLAEQNLLLQQRLEAVEKHAISAQKGSLEQNYNHALNSVRAAEAALAKAIEIGDGARVPELLRQRDQAMAQATEINRVKTQFSQAPAPVRSEVTERAKKWAAKNPWFRANSNDPDSAAAKAIDANLVAEGLDPSTKKYWKELTRRVAERLPHRIAQGEDSGYTGPQNPGRRGPPVGGSTGNVAPGSKPIDLSSARLQALDEAGLLDDPKARKRMEQRYKAWDREWKTAR